MILLFAALLPCLALDGDAACQADAKSATKLASPGVEYRMNEASASRSPWLTSNGWMIQRKPQAKFYYDVKGDAAEVAAVEAFAYGVEAVIHADAKGAAAFARILPFLKQVKPLDLPVVANIGVVDDGSEEVGELMNLLTRHNLLYRIVPAPDPKLAVNVKIGMKEFPKEEAADANRMSHQVRSMLTDERRALRIYGSEVIVGRLTSDGSRARLELINYGKDPVQGVRVRVRGVFARNELAMSGAPGAKLEEFAVEGDATEFTISAMNRFAVIDLFAKK